MYSRPKIPDGPYVVVGLARSGQAAAKLLSGRGFEVVGVDAGHPEGVETLGDYGVEAHCGSDGAALVEQADAIVKSPGVPSDAPAIAAARAAGKTVLGELELGWRFLPNRFIAITGTNGKTTTAELLGEIFRAAGLPVVVAGNVGTPLCELVGTIDPEAVVICEASSFQIEDSLAFAPECAVLLNVAPDHIDRHGSFEAYRAAKLEMFSRQGPDDVAVLGPTIDFAVPGAARQVVADAVALDPACVAMRGPHNLENAAAAAAAAQAMDVPRQAIDEVLATFKGVEHRMEEVAEIGGVTFINDSKATNVAATLAALSAFDGGVHAILGGSLKGERFGGLCESVERACEAVYLIGESAPALSEDLAAAKVPIDLCGTLETAFERAVAAAEPGGTVLLAPACASFDQFKNYERRGECFKRLVGELPAAGVARGESAA